MGLLWQDPLEMIGRKVCIECELWIRTLEWIEQLAPDFHNPNHRQITLIKTAMVTITTWTPRLARLARMTSIAAPDRLNG